MDGFVGEFLRELNFGQGVSLARATVNDQHLALARTVRQYLMARWLEAIARQRRHPVKAVGYLSAEYLLGRQLDNALLATGLVDVVREGLAALRPEPGHAARRRRWSRGSATAASAGSPPASSTPSPP